MSTSTETKPPVVIGLIADTHCKLADGSDLPDAATDALRGCDLIVHLGDLTSLGVLDRLAAGGAEVIGIRNPILDVPAGTDPRLVDGPVYRDVLGRRLAFVREYPDRRCTSRRHRVRRTARWRRPRSPGRAGRHDSHRHPRQSEPAGAARQPSPA